MPLKRQRKEELVGRYSGELAAAPHVFLVDYKGITVPQATELRRLIAQSGGSYEVVRNRLALLALGDTPLAELREHFQGPTAAAFGDGDPVALAKVLKDFAKEVPSLEFKAGLVEGQQVAADEIAQIADLPSREELLAKLLYLLQSPVTRFVRTLAALPRQFVVVMDQIKRKKEEEQ